MTLHAMHAVHGTVVAGDKPVTWIAHGLPRRTRCHDLHPGAEHPLPTSDGRHLRPATPARHVEDRYSGVSNDPTATWSRRGQASGTPTPPPSRRRRRSLVPAVSDLGTTTLTDGGSISGTVRDSATGLPVRDIDVRSSTRTTRSAAPSSAATTAPTSSACLATGAYKVKAFDDRGAHVRHPVLRRLGDQRRSDPVPVIADDKTTGIDLTLVAVVAHPIRRPSSSAGWSPTRTACRSGGRGVGVRRRRRRTPGPATFDDLHTDLTGHYAFTGADRRVLSAFTFNDAYGDPDDDDYASRSMGAGLPGRALLKLRAPPCPGTTSPPTSPLTALDCCISGTLLPPGDAAEPYVPLHGRSRSTTTGDGPDQLEAARPAAASGLRRLEPGTYTSLQRGLRHRHARAGDHTIDASCPTLQVTHVPTGASAYSTRRGTAEVVGSPALGQTLTVAPGQQDRRRLQVAGPATQLRWSTGS